MKYKEWLQEIIKQVPKGVDIHLSISACSSGFAWIWGKDENGKKIDETIVNFYKQPELFTEEDYAECMK